MKRNLSLNNTNLIFLLIAICFGSSDVFAIDWTINQNLGPLKFGENIELLPNSGVSVFPRHELIGIEGEYRGLHGEYIRQIAGKCSRTIVAHHGLDPLLPVDILKMTDAPKNTKYPIICISCNQGSSLGEGPGQSWAKLTGNEAISLINSDGRDLKIKLSRNWRGRIVMNYLERITPDSDVWRVITWKNDQPQWVAFQPDGSHRPVSEVQVLRQLQMPCMSPLVRRALNYNMNVAQKWSNPEVALPAAKSVINSTTSLGSRAVAFNNRNGGAPVMAGGVVAGLANDLTAGMFPIDDSYTRDKNKMGTDREYLGHGGSGTLGEYLVGTHTTSLSSIGKYWGVIDYPDGKDGAYWDPTSDDFDVLPGNYNDYRDFGWNFLDSFKSQYSW
jgi:hypothetical protein